MHQLQPQALGHPAADTHPPAPLTLITCSLTMRGPTSRTETPRRAQAAPASPSPTDALRRAEPMTRRSRAEPTRARLRRFMAPRPGPAQPEGEGLEAERSRAPPLAQHRPGGKLNPREAERAASAEINPCINALKPYTCVYLWPLPLNLPLIFQGSGVFVLSSASEAALGETHR